MRSLELAALLVLPAAVASAQPRLALDHEAIADRIVKQLALKPGERVLLVAHPGLLEPLVPELRYAVIKAGGIDLGVIEVLPDPWPERWDAALLRKANAAAREASKAMLKDVDAAVMLPGALPVHPAYAALQEWLKEGRGRTVHFHWLENGSAYALPGHPLPAPHVIDAFYQRALLRTDYTALAALQRRFEAEMRAGEVRITSPAGTDLRFRIGDRPVTLQDGDASAARAARGRVLIDREIELPAGAVRVAPLEETVEGVLAFPPSQWMGKPVEGLKLRFSKGRVSEVAATSGRDEALEEMAKAGDAGRAFREFALGLNPELAVPERMPWIPYYGYGAGVVRLSLGDNSELGGNVKGGYVRWNFFVDTTVAVGAQVWIKDGKLVAR
jgi:hypothetical protein